MKELVWHFPTNLAEAIDLVRDGAPPHAGGTGILRTGASKLTRLVDLHRLPLEYLDVTGDVVEMGAMLTFSDVVTRMQSVDPGSILIESLGQAASTPLRNRITLGGSVAMAPPWSDLIGPLLALDAEVVLAPGRGTETTCPVARFLDDRAARKGTLVKAIRFRPGAWDSVYCRATRTHFDYAAFTLTALVRKNPRGEVEEARLVVTGNKRRYQRLAAQEQAVIGRKAEDVADLSQVVAGAQADVEFGPKSIGGPEYVGHLFGVELERALKRAIRGW